jgi:hypothetical protein
MQKRLYLLRFCFVFLLHDSSVLADRTLEANPRLRRIQLAFLTGFSASRIFHREREPGALTSFRVSPM